MSIRFNADEIFEMAERLEINGAKFYRAAAESFKGSRAADTLLKLASMEDEHRIIFAAIRANAADQAKEDFVSDPDEEVKKYLQAFVDGHIFDIKSDPSKTLTGKETIEEILYMAIGIEKDSIIFYLGMKDLVPKDLGQDKILQIVAEEKRHIVTITDDLNALNK